MTLYCQYMSDDLEFAAIDLTIDDDEPAPETWPLAGTGTLIVEDKAVVLFTSADYTVVARVIRNGHDDAEIAKSTASNKPHTQAFLKRWTRELIRSNKVRLKRLGVDVDSEYLSWGGIVKDLE